MPGQGNRIDFVTGAPEKYAALVDALAVIPNQFRAAVGTASDATMQREPGPGQWSALRNLAHCTFIAEANDVFITQMAKMSNPTRKAFPVGYVAEDLEALPVAELLDRLEAAVGRTVTLLGHTPDAAWGRPGEARGMRRSIRQMVVVHTTHFDEHIVTIAALTGTKAAAR